MQNIQNHWKDLIIQSYWVDWAIKWGNKEKTLEELSKMIEMAKKIMNILESNK